PRQQIDVCRRVRAINMAGTGRYAKSYDTGFFHQPYNFYIIDVPIGVHIAPTQGNIDGDHIYSCVCCVISLLTYGYSVRSSATVTSSWSVIDFRSEVH